MSRKAKLIAGDETYRSADTETHEGAPAWKFSPKERLVMTLLTNTMEPTFYADSRKLATDTLDNHREVLDSDPEFYMKALVYARTEGYMRLQPILGTVLLSTKDIPIPASVFNKVMRTPNDIASFIDLCRNAKIRKGMGQKVKALLHQWLANKISQYWAIKYAQPLTQAIKLSHPKMTAEWERPIAWAQAQRQVIRKRLPEGEDIETETEAQAIPLGTAKDLVDYMMAKDKKEPFSTEVIEKLPQIKEYEALKEKVYQQEEISIGEVRRAIHEARLPHEALTGMISPTKEIWKELMYNMPYFALLRHLETLRKAGVFEDREALMYMCDRISDPNAVERSMILPYRFYITYQKVKSSGAPQPLIEALEFALNASFRTIGDLEGAGCIAIDVSGSMTGTHQIGKRVSLRYIDIAATFGIPLMMKSPDAIVLPFDMAGGLGYTSYSSRRARGLYPDLLDRSRPMLWNIDQLSRRVGGGTDCSLPVRYLEDNDIKVDWFIGITDDEEWGGQRGSSGEGWLVAWRRYRERIVPEAKAFVVTISPYGHSMYPFQEPNVYQIFGWSDQVLRFIHLGIAGIETQIQHIENLPLELEIVEL